MKLFVVTLAIKFIFWLRFPKHIPLDLIQIENFLFLARNLNSVVKGTVYPNLVCSVPVTALEDYFPVTSEKVGKWLKILLLLLWERCIFILTLLIPFLLCMRSTFSVHLRNSSKMARNRTPTVTGTVYAGLVCTVN